MSKFVFKGANGTTGWLDQSANVRDLGISVLFTGSGSIDLQVSDDPTFTNKQYDTLGTFRASSGRLLMPREAGTYFRFIFSSWVSGTATIHVGDGIGADGRNFAIQQQSSTGASPSSDAGTIG